MHRWREKSWARRYRAILVSHEEEAQVRRLAYLLENGIKEGLVARPHQNFTSSFIGVVSDQGIPGRAATSATHVPSLKWSPLYPVCTDPRLTARAADPPGPSPGVGAELIHR